MKTQEIREPAVLMTAAERMQIDANGITALNSVIPIDCLSTVSYTHLTLPTNREV